MDSDPLKAPPVLNDEICYTDWKFDLSMWQMYTKVEAERRGPAVYLCLSGKAKECLRVLDPIEIGKSNGLDLIIETLDKQFLKDENTRSFMALNEFLHYHRGSGDSIPQFIVTFERLYHKLCQFDIRTGVKFGMSEGMKTNCLLNAANISEDDERTARASCPGMTYDTMKLVIQKMFADPTAAENKEETPPVKSEPVLFNQNRRYNNYKGSYDRNRQSDKSSSSKQWGRRRNAHGSDGKVMECYRCGSDTHLARNCDGSGRKNRQSTDGSSNSRSVDSVHITLLNENDTKDLPTLVYESLGMAVLDSGCRNNVMGVKWLTAYLDTLTDAEKDMVSWKDSNAKFKFGDGVEVPSKGIVKIPASVAEKPIFIESDVVNNDIPLLLSQNAMRTADMISR